MTESANTTVVKKTHTVLQLPAESVMDFQVAVHGSSFRPDTYEQAEGQAIHSLIEKERLTASFLPCS